MTRPASPEDCDAVESLADFVAYLYLLSAEAEAELGERDGSRWRNTTVPDFLAAIDTAVSAEPPRSPRVSENERAGEGRWAHPNLPGWLATWGAWLADAYLNAVPEQLVKLGIRREPVEPVGWRSIAIQLSGARIYE